MEKCVANWEAAQARSPDGGGRGWRPSLGSRPRPLSEPPASGEPPPQRPRLARPPRPDASPGPAQADSRGRQAGGDPGPRKADLAERLKHLQRTDAAVKEAWRAFARDKTPEDGGSWKLDPCMATLATLESFFEDALPDVQGSADRSRSRGAWQVRHR